MKNQNIGKNVRNLILRYIMFCGLVFMCIPLISSSPSILGPVFGVFFYFSAGLISSSSPLPLKPSLKELGMTTVPPVSLMDS